MSLEQTLERIAVALEQSVEIMRQNRPAAPVAAAPVAAAPVTAAPVAAAPVAAAPVAAAPVAAAPVAAAPEDPTNDNPVTYDQVKARVVELAPKNKKGVLDVFARFNVKTATELTEAQWPEVLQLLNELE